ncbi:MAG: IS630 family transposase [Aggregatilineales bacterium]
MDVGFVAPMEDVLTTYALAYEADYPQVCLDEKLVTLHADVVEPLPVQPGQPERVDYEYERVGTANLFVMVERLAGYRHVEVTARRTAEDYARQLQWLADVRYPDAKKIRLVQDNLNTHRLANLYLVFPPAETRRLAERFELHYTPTHGSWLNMAEIEIGIVERECLGRRVPDRATLQRRVLALETERNSAQATINWRFTTTDARSKLARLYPKLEEADLPRPN